MKGNLTRAIIAGLSVSLTISLFFNIKEDTVAVVGDEKITKEEFYDYMKVKYGKEVLDDMLLQASLYKGDKIPFNEILAELKKVEKGKIEKEEFVGFVEKSTLEYDRKVFEENVKDKVLVGEEDLKSVFESEKELFDVTYVRIGNREKAIRAYEMITGGKKLLEVNQEYLKEEFGQNLITTGLVKKEELNPKIYELVKGLNEGEVSDLFESEGYYYIVELSRKQKKSFEEFKTEYLEKKAQELNIDVKNKYLTELLKLPKVKEPYFK